MASKNRPDYTDLDFIRKRMENAPNYFETKIDRDAVLQMSIDQKDASGKMDITKELAEEAKEKNAIFDISLDKISKSPKNVFKPYDEEKLEELKASIADMGVLDPAIVRPAASCETYSVPGEYELISGHNRYDACMALGLETMPCAIIDMDDVTASKMIAATNIYRDEISEIEKARSFRITYDLMKGARGGDHTSDEYKESRAKYHADTLLEDGDRILDKLAKEYNVSPMTLHRKLRLSYLTDDVVDKYEKKKITQDQAVQLSYAEPNMQNLIMHDYYSSTDKEWLTDEKAKEVGRISRDLGGLITPRHLENIFMKEEKNKKVRAIKITIPKELLPAGLKVRDREAYVHKALEYILDHKIDLTADHEAEATEDMDA